MKFRYGNLADVGTDCSNSCVARYLSIISRAAQSSAVPFRERSRVRAGNYAVDAVFSHTPRTPVVRQLYDRCRLFMKSVARSTFVKLS